VRDYDAKGHVERYRCWDSCMHSDFTKMAHGNPRKGRMERFRQSYMHKLVYFRKITRAFLPAQAAADACEFVL
jgi:sulfhydrogenase subunit beta (sulfur reductase)